MNDGETCSALAMLSKPSCWSSTGSRSRDRPRARADRLDGIGVLGAIQAMQLDVARHTASRLDRDSPRATRRSRRPRHSSAACRPAAASSGRAAAARPVPRSRRCPQSRPGSSTRTRDSPSGRRRCGTRRSTWSRAASAGRSVLAAARANRPPPQPASNPPTHSAAAASFQGTDCIKPRSATGGRGRPAGGPRNSGRPASRTARSCPTCASNSAVGFAARTSSVARACVNSSCMRSKIV